MVSDLVQKKNMVSDNANKTLKIYLSKILWTPEYGNLMEFSTSLVSIVWGFSQLLLSIGAKKLVIEGIYVSSLKSTHTSEFVTCSHSIAFGAFFSNYLISLAIFQGFYLNILAQSGLLLSSACQKTHNSLLLLVPKTLSSLLAWMGGNACVCVLLMFSFLPSYARLHFSPA